MLLSNKNANQFFSWYKKIPEIGAELLIDKDAEWTSFDAVAKTRSMLKVKKIGHAGTLDPLASGLLILCLGKSTKKANHFQSMKKLYQGVFRLGATTKTDDAEAEEENICEYEHISEKQVKECSKKFVGKILQKPPMYSAKHVKGKRLYQLARKNIEIEVEPVQVEVYRFDVLSVRMPFVSVEIECSKGTYIRSIARDLGSKLGAGAYLASLRRIAIGGYHVDDAFKIKELEKLAGEYKEFISKTKNGPGKR